MTAPALDRGDVKVWVGDSRTAWADLPAQSADAIITSPPYYGLRDYGVHGQIGLETTPNEYVTGLADLLTAWGTSVLKPVGSLWLNLGDSYSTGSGTPTDSMARLGERLGTGGGHKIADARRLRSPVQGVPAKSLLGIPWRVAFALIDRGWILRNDVIWAKPNGMPSSVTDRLANKHEHLFHLVRQPRYYYDLDAIRVAHFHPRRDRWDRREPRTDQPRAGQTDARVGNHEAGANPGDVWQIATQPYAEAHYAVFPAELVRRPILATVPEQVCTRQPGLAVDPFIGSGTLAAMCRRLGRRCWGVDLDGGNLPLIDRRIGDDSLFTPDDEPATAAVAGWDEPTLFTP